MTLKATIASLLDCVAKRPAVAGLGALGLVGALASVALVAGESPMMTVETPATASIAPAETPTLADTRLPTPEGDVVLTIRGAITRTTDGETAQFDVDQLEALGLRTLETRTPWTTEREVFDGVLLSDLLEHVGAVGETLEAVALDGYTIDMPVADTAYPVLLTTRRDGVRMTVRNRGPIWVIYPIEQFPELDIEAYSSRSIWQLTALTVK